MHYGYIGQGNLGANCACCLLREGMQVTVTDINKEACQKALDAGANWADSPAELAGIAGQLSAWRVTPSGTEGYRTAEVTLGGVSTDEVSSKTMESQRSPGLYFVGEVLDVSGHLGGFNFQWAWASGYAAGQYA